MSLIKIEVNKKDLPTSTVQLEIKVPFDEWRRFELRITSRLAQGLKIPGFRPGKAPLNLVKNQLEEEKIAQEVLEEILPLSYAEAVKKTKIRPVGPPKIKITQFEKGKDFIYTAECALWPKFNLPDYRKIKVKKPKVEVEDKEVEREIKLLRKRLASVRPKKGVIKKGDRVLVDYQGSIKGKNIPELNKKDVWLIVGETVIFPGFGEKIVGKKKGETVKFTLNLPKDFVQKGLGGQKITFNVLIKKVEKIVLPSSQELVKKLGHKDEKEMKQKIKEFIKQQKESEAEKRWEAEIVSEIVKKTKIQLSPYLVDQERDRLLQQLSQDLALQGATLDRFLESSKISKDDLADQLKKQAENNLKSSFVLHAIADKEKIRIEDKEVDESLEQERTRLRLQGYPESEIESQLKNPEIKAQVKTQLKLAKTLNFLKSLHKKG